MLKINFVVIPIIICLASLTTLIVGSNVLLVTQLVTDDDINLVLRLAKVGKLNCLRTHIVWSFTPRWRSGIFQLLFVWWRSTNNSANKILTFCPLNLLPEQIF